MDPREKALIVYRYLLRKVQERILWAHSALAVGAWAELEEYRWWEFRKRWRRAGDLVEKDRAEHILKMNTPRVQKYILIIESLQRGETNQAYDALVEEWSYLWHETNFTYHIGSIGLENLRIELWGLSKSPELEVQMSTISEPDKV